MLIEADLKLDRLAEELVSRLKPSILAVAEASLEVELSLPFHI